MENIKSVLYVLFIAAAILFSLGGAFNVGMTGFWLAVPFMICIAFLSFKKGRIVFLASIIFILVCVVINLTIYKNPFVFPILQKGVQIEVVNDSLYRKFSDGSGFFTKSDDVSKDNMQIIFKLKKSQKIDIIKIYNFGGIDSTNHNYMVTEFGNMSEKEIEKGNIQITPKVLVQSNWSKYLGNLMYWPAFPIFLLTLFK